VTALGVGTAVRNFKVINVMYHYWMGLGERPWNLNVTVLLGGA
jgi:hypothetical protein